MADRSGRSRRCHSRRIGRLVCGLAAVIAALAGLAAFASARSASNNPVARAAADNPALTVGCGLKVALVLDESQSISSTGFNATGEIRSAATGFVTALEGTGSPLAITAFHSFGRPGPEVPVTGGPSTSVGYAEVTSGNLSTFTNWIGTGPASNNPTGYNPPTSASTGRTGVPASQTSNPNGTTNWQDAFQQVARTPDGPPNLVVFVTDGDPNTVGTPGNSAFNDTARPTDGTGGLRFVSNNETGFNTATGPAETAANELKGRGVRIFGIAVGPDVQGSTSVGRIQRVTGPTEGPNPLTADYALVSNFDDLRAELTRLVASLCGSRLIITKEVPDHTGTLTEASGWKFTATLTPAGGHTWLHPPTATDNTATGPTAELTTGSDGIADFQWRLHTAEHTVDVSAIHETEEPGFHFVAATCQNERPEGPVGQPEVSDTGIPARRSDGRISARARSSTGRRWGS